jgi:hypothetical protein
MPVFTSIGKDIPDGRYAYCELSTTVTVVGTRDEFEMAITAPPEATGVTFDGATAVPCILTNIPNKNTEKAWKITEGGKIRFIGSDFEFSLDSL